jgi:hypothetical protein
MCSDRYYHLRRAEQELDRARVTNNNCARLAHLELAQLHAQVAASRPPGGDGLIASERGGARAAEYGIGGEANAVPTPPIMILAVNDR